MPIQISIDFAEGPPLALLRIEARLGDAALLDLRSHAEWKPRNARALREWLYAILLQPE